MQYWWATGGGEENNDLFVHPTAKQVAGFHITHPAVLIRGTECVPACMRATRLPALYFCMSWLLVIRCTARCHTSSETSSAPESIRERMVSMYQAMEGA